MLMEDKREREKKRIQTITQTIFDDDLRVYKRMRKEYDEEIRELEVERRRISRKRKIKKSEKGRLLLNNTRCMTLYIVRALQDTIQQYKLNYLEDDYYRLKRIGDITGVYKTPGEKMKALAEVYNNFLHSPFKDDRLFALKQLV